MAGKLYNMQAHLHDGGISVGLKVNGVKVCESKATYGGAKGTTVISGEKWETIQGYEMCSKSVDLKLSDQLVVEATYDLRAHKL
jgi:hypothetical protein